MNKPILGKNLLFVYGAFAVIFFFMDTSGFPLYQRIEDSLIAVNYYPTLYILKFIPMPLNPIIWVIAYLGFAGLAVFSTALQAALLYYGGNLLEKVIKNR